MLLHLDPLQKPNTPYVMSLNSPRRTNFVMGTEITDNKRKTNATNSNTVSGVAGRIIATAAFALCSVEGKRAATLLLAVGEAPEERSRKLRC